MKNTLKTVLYLACCAAVGGTGFYFGRTTAASSGKAAPDKAHVASNAGTHRVGGTQLAMERSAVDDFLKSKGKPDADKLAEWAKSLNPDECAAYLDELQKLPPGLQRDAVLKAVIASWADKDPQGFLATTKNITGPQMREQGTDAALKSWAAQNPQQALQWLKDNPGTAPNSALQARYVAAITGFASVDPQGAFAAVSALGENTLSDQRVKSQAMQAVVGSLTDQGKFTDATAMIAQLPDGSPTKNQAYGSLAVSWAQTNPQDASAWVSSLTDPTMRTNLGAQVVAQWANTDPASAVAWAAQMDAQASASAQNGNASGPTTYLLANAMGTWAAYDLDGPANYLNQLPASPDKDGAVASFALYAGQEDPQSAMNWVNTISDDQMRQRLAMVTALQWSATDPNGYNQFLSTTKVLTDQQKQMLSNIPPQAGQFLSGGFGGGGGGGSAAPGGIPPRLQNFIINGGGAGGFGGGAFFGGGAQANPGGPNQPAPANAALQGRQSGPMVILSQRTRRGNGGGG